jgi:hypothetical protein
VVDCHRGARSAVLDSTAQAETSTGCGRRWSTPATAATAARGTSSGAHEPRAFCCAQTSHDRRACTAGQAGIPTHANETIARGDEQEPRPRLLPRHGSGCRRHARGLAWRPVGLKGASAHPPLTRPLDGRTGEFAPLLLRLVAQVIDCRGILRSCAGPVTRQAPATTRRPPLQSSASSGHGDTGRHGPEAHRLRSRT